MKGPTVVLPITNVCSQDRKSGRTPFFLALDSKNQEAAKALIILQANLSTQNYAGQCPPNNKTIKKLIDQKDNIFNVLARPSSTRNSLDTRRKIVEDNVNKNCGGSVKKHRKLPKKTNSLSDKPKSFQAVYGTANGSLSDEFQNKGSSNKFVQCNTGIGQKDDKEMFANGRNNSQIVSNFNLENHSPLLVKDKISHSFIIPQIIQPKKTNRNTDKNKLRVIKNVKGNFTNNSPPLDNSFLSKTSGTEEFMLRSEITNNPFVSHDNGSVQATSCSSFVIDNVNIVETLSDGVTNNNSAVSDDNELSVKTGNCTLVAIDYGNVLDTLSYDKINNESQKTDDNGHVKSTSCTSFAIDNVNIFGTLSDCMIDKDPAVIDCIPSSAVFEFSMHSPSQEIVNDVVPHDLQSEQPGIQKDGGLKICCDERTDITSKLQSNNEGKNKRKNIKIRSQNGTKKSKKK